MSGPLPTRNAPTSPEALDVKAGRLRQWFCYCTNPQCRGGDPRWRCADGTREFFVYGNVPVVCPQCGEKGSVYPY